MGLMDWLRSFRPPNTRPAATDARLSAPVHASAATRTLQFTNWEGYGYLGIVGESQYQDALLRISRSGRICEATLMPEPDNPFDPNAVAVYIGGMVVGYFPRSSARKYHRRLLMLTQPLRCPAKLIGGTRDKPYFGVLLDHREVERLPAPKRTRQKTERIDPAQTPF